jgi:THAP4-like, heme-binding beta-barrel domain
VSSDAESPMAPPPWLNAPPVEPYPYEDTYDLRKGPDLHHDLLGLLPFVGMWRGRGQGGFPAPEDYNFAQEITISHDGRPFLRYESRAWLLDDDSNAIGESVRELGFWRPTDNGDGIEATMITPDGVMELYLGKVIGTTRLEMETDAIVRTPTGAEVTAGQRLFGIVEGALLYAHEMAAGGSGPHPHLSARLIRVGG